MNYTIIDTDVTEQILSNLMEDYLNTGYFQFAEEKFYKEGMESIEYYLLKDKEIVLKASDLDIEDIKNEEFLDIIIKLLEEYKKKYPITYSKEPSIVLSPNKKENQSKITLPTLHTFLSRDIKTIDLGDLNILINIETLWDSTANGFSNGIFYKLTFVDKIRSQSKSIKYNYLNKEDLTILDLLELAEIF